MRLHMCRKLYTAPLSQSLLTGGFLNIKEYYIFRYIYNVFGNCKEFTDTDLRKILHFEFQENNLFSEA